MSNKHDMTPQQSPDILLVAAQPGVARSTGSLGAAVRSRGMVQQYACLLLIAASACQSGSNTAPRVTCPEAIQDGHIAVHYAGGRRAGAKQGQQYAIETVFSASWDDTARSVTFHTSLGEGSECYSFPTPEWNEVGDGKTTDLDLDVSKMASTDEVRKRLEMGYSVRVQIGVVAFPDPKAIPHDWELKLHIFKNQEILSCDCG